MEVKQIATLVNDFTSQYQGQVAMLEEDLSNVIDVGNTLENIGGLDNYVRSLPNMIGKIVFVNRKYPSSSPDIMVDGWEFGSILGKYRTKIPEATENESWELTDGTSYDMGIFTKPFATTKYFNKRTTFEIPISITEKQVKESFHSATEMNSFFSMIYNAIETSMTIKLDSLKMRTINNLIGETLYDGLTSGGTTDYGSTSIRAVNLLALYNADHTGATITADEALTNADFMRFAVYKIGMYRDFLTRNSVLFNIGGTEKFSPKEYQKAVFLTDFVKSMGVYLYNAPSQFNTDNLRLDSFDTVPYWQAMGTDTAFATRSSVKIETANGHSVDCSGIIGTIFDKDAAMVCNMDRRVTTAPYNAKGEFWNSWHKWDCEYLNDFDENCIVFFIHDEED